MEPVVVYFGSETGTAEFFAGELGELLDEEKIPNEVRDLADWDKEGFMKHKVVVLVVATHGEGEPTKSAEKFAKWVKRKTTPTDSLSGVKFTVMGLGDMNYTTYNKMGEDTDRHMERLGGVRVYKRGVGDAGGDIEQDFADWKEGLVPALRAAFAGGAEASGAEASGAEANGIEPAAKQPKAETGAPEATLVWGQKTAPAQQPSEALAQALFGAVPLLCRATQLNPRCVEVQFETADYAAAGNCDVIVPNDPAVVQFFAEQLGVADRLDDAFCFSGAQRFPTPCSVRDCLTYFLDLARVPAASRLAKWPLQLDGAKRAQLDARLEALEREKDACLTFREFWQEALERQCLTFAQFVLGCPLARPRAFSHASSAPDTLQCCVAIEQHEVAAAGPRPARTVTGLASACFLRALAAPERVLFKPRASSLDIAKLQLPALLIGTGAGIAPMRSVWQHLKLHRPEALAQLTVVVGARTEEEVLYREEAAALKLTCLQALSRQPGQPKEYVQDVLRREQEKVRATLAVGSCWVCGRAGVGPAVLEVLAEVCDVPALQRDQRIQLEVWG